ncbi:quercetin dioxygenase-like cupin family protein [Streptosporangium becharense]|uniref:Quercetin dioxygenase-like cupin family protein n=1 Tax=Streptosporangium becharense TaxID=1816182 RepID=A0A7W9MFP4_9ACTN|nr:quercetin 2,3-dioxygenase [Streptosporangium becharense]MBB2912077.1 quercetin dioxygenase-like cupin family protein [Streptosporangium becharense]MBB5818624.1 quercetin dioxygenase-like cupin family protein [Streptosporangium becharense]
MSNEKKAVMTHPASVRPYVRRDGEGDTFWFLGSLVTVKTTGAETHGRLTIAEFVNPPGFSPPLHRHLAEDELFYLLSGVATFHCDGETFTAGPGDLVFFPMGLPHSFVVGPDAPLRSLQITTPSGFEHFAAAVGEPAYERRLPGPLPVDPAALGHAAARYGIEVLGPPPEPPPGR